MAKGYANHAITPSRRATVTRRSSPDADCQQSGNLHGLCPRQYHIILFSLHNGASHRFSTASITLACPASNIPARISLMMHAVLRYAGYRPSPPPRQQTLGNCAHQWTLTFIAIATTAKVHHSLPAQCRRAACKAFSSAPAYARNPPPPSVCLAQ